MRAAHPDSCRVVLKAHFAFSNLNKASRGLVVSWTDVQVVTGSALLHRLCFGIVIGYSNGVCCGVVCCIFSCAAYQNLNRRREPDLCQCFGSS